MSPSAAPDATDASDHAEPADLLVVAERAVLPGGEQAAAVVVRAGVIDAVLDPLGPLPAARQVVHLGADEVLMPALVDSHVHANEPGRTHWEGLRTLTAAAAAGGIGTVVDMPLNCIPATVTAEAVEIKRASCPVPAVDVGMWGGAVGGRLDVMPELLGAGVWGLKAFMLDSGVAEFPALMDDPGLVLAMEACAAAGVPLLVHAEDAEEAAAAPHAIATMQYADLLAARPVPVEVVAIERLARLMEGIPEAHVHVVHVTSAEGVATIAAAQARGLHLTGESCPHYLFLSAETVPDGDPSVKCFPPIRERRHQDALWAGLIDGTLSLVASDHSPAPWPLKDTGDLGTGWGGIASIQVSLPVTWTAARSRGLALTDIVRWMAQGPADLAGLPQKGRLAAGADADLIVFDPEATFTVHGADLLHRHPQTPYEGAELHGIVRRTWLRGELVDPAAPHGRWLMKDEAPAPQAAADAVPTATGAPWKANHPSA